jgi:hypothetical protein
MDWRIVDEGLIRRGELLLSLDFLESYDLELNVLNNGRVGDYLSLLKAILCSSLLYVIYSLCLTGRLRDLLEL